MAKFDETRQLILGCVAILLCVVAVNLWLFSGRSLESAGQDTATTTPVTATQIPTKARPSQSQNGGQTSSRHGMSPHGLRKLSGAEPLPAISPEVAEEIKRLSIEYGEIPQEEINPDGSATINLQGRYKSVTAAALKPDGDIVIRHGEDFLQNVEEN